MTHTDQDDATDIPHADRMSSPFQEGLGLRLIEWGEGIARVACDVQPGHENRQGVAHGGLVLTMLDEAGGAAGNWSADAATVRRSVTVDLNARFTAPARGRLIATARMVSHGGRLYFVQSEVRDAAGTVVAIGSSTHRWRST